MTTYLNILKAWAAADQSVMDSWEKRFHTSTFDINPVQPTIGDHIALVNARLSNTHVVIGCILKELTAKEESDANNGAV